MNARIAKLADRIEAELQRIGWWSATPLDPARLVDMGAFGMNTLAAQEWLQFVLVPRLREVATGTTPLPASSSVAVWATRELDGAPDADALLDLLRELDDAVEPAEPDPDALHVAAAGGHPLLAAALAGSLTIDLAELGPRPTDPDVIRALVARGAPIDQRAGAIAWTPLMTASYFGHAEIVATLLELGADRGARDALGRSAERLAVFPMIARLIGICARLPMITRAYVSQLHAPASHQYTSPLVGLELSAPLPADAFAGWPADEPIVLFVLGEDTLSRLVKLSPPVYSGKS